ncbi:uroporphyrinogen-III synthase [Hydrogenimonas sp.]
MKEETRRPVYFLSPTPKKGAIHLPMIAFRLLPQTLDFSRYDGVILTSKQGVAALDQISGGSWRALPAAAIGRQTAREIEKRGGEVCFMASSAYGDVLAKELAQAFPKRRWLYARPKVVVSKIAADLKEAGVAVEEAVIYETVCVPYGADERPEEGAVLVFSAPSIVRCFFENFGWDKSWDAVAIGKKTAQAFPEGVKPHISPATTLEDSLDFARHLASNQRK